MLELALLFSFYLKSTVFSNLHFCGTRFYVHFLRNNRDFGVETLGKCKEIYTKQNCWFIDLPYERCLRSM